VEKIKQEIGVHRVQRLTKTDRKEKRHTSTASVAVIPIIQEEKIKISDKDLDISTFKSQGAGGQHVNTTDSAVRIHHIPSGIVVSSQSSRSQHQNKEEAMRLLEAKLKQIQKEKVSNQTNNQRKNQIKNQNRSESIRTYNYIRSEVTQHETGKKANLKKVLNGNLNLIVE
jgi:peptide chain release factor 1